MVRPGVSIKGLMVAVVLISVAMASLRYASDAWAASVRLATMAILLASILGVVYLGGARRAFWLGFAVFGWGYLLQVATGTSDVPTSSAQIAGGRYKFVSEPVSRPVLASAFDALYPMIHLGSETGEAGGLPGWLGSWFGRNAAIHRALDSTVPMRFGTETPLEDFLAYVKDATKSEGLPGGIPIYADPVSLTEAEKTLQSPVTLELEGVPLRTSLSLALKQLDLKYVFGDGTIQIVYIASSPKSIDALGVFHTLGHCYATLLAGLLGGVVGRVLQAKGQRALPLPR